MLALTTAAAVVGISLMFHVLAGGHAPNLSSLAILAALVAMATTPLTHGKVNLTGLLLVLGAAQVALHLAFEAHPGSSGGHHVHGAGAHHTHGDEPVMVMATMHAAATLLTALLISRCRAALRRATAWCSLRHLLLHVRELAPRHRPPPTPAPRMVPIPVPGTGAVMSRAPPRLVPSAS